MLWSSSRTQCSTIAARWSQLQTSHSKRQASSRHLSQTHLWLFHVQQRQSTHQCRRHSSCLHTALSLAQTSSSRSRSCQTRSMCSQAIQASSQRQADTSLYSASRSTRALLCMHHQTRCRSSRTHQDDTWSLSSHETAASCSLQQHCLWSSAMWSSASRCSHGLEV